MAKSDERADVDWARATDALDAQGHATLNGLLSPAECAALAALYDEREPFRSRIVMERHAYGVGEYKYFAYPLPPAVATLRQALYGRLTPIANAWAARLGSPERYPATLDPFLDSCHRAGQTRPTPLLLRYEAGCYNCLHQDRYGALAFPLQATILLSSPGGDFTGGEFVLVEQRPRAQSRAEVVALGQGDAVLFPNVLRPVAGKRGDYRVALRHGVSRVTGGKRLALGIIFHDAS